MDQSNSVYIPKEKAAKKLGLGPRRVLELAKQGLLGKQRVWSDKTHRHQVLISEPDVDSYLARQKEISENGGISPPKNGAIVQETALMRMAENITHIREVPFGRPKYEDWQWLSLEEAQVETRLPIPALLKAMIDGRLPHIKIGRGARAWWIRYSSLKSFDGAALKPAGTDEREEEVATRGWQP